MMVYSDDILVFSLRSKGHSVSCVFSNCYPPFFDSYSSNFAPVTAPTDIGANAKNWPEVTVDAFHKRKKTFLAGPVLI